MHREHRVEEMRKTYALSLRYQAEECAIAIEAPWPALLDQFQARLIVAIDQLVSDLAGGGLVGQLQCLRAEPLDVDHRHQCIGHNAAYGSVGLELFEFQHAVFTIFCSKNKVVIPLI